MAHFLKSGANYNVVANANVDIRDLLPTGTYTVGYNEREGSFFLTVIEDFEIKGKLYGDTQKNADRILNTFGDRPASTGVMLNGEKGSGKTLLAKKVSIEGRALGYPTIVINQAWAGEAFNNFMQMIEQPIIVIFDEFEKVYDNEDQEKILTLLDGVYPSKKLFIITSNDNYRVNSHMMNRPGRIFYRFDYSGLSVEFIREYCDDNLNNKTHIEAICRISVVFTKFNFDILKALVEEMNRYDEAPRESMQVLNAKPDSGQQSYFEVTLFVGGEEIDKKNLESVQWYGNPLISTVGISYRAEGKKYETDEYGDLDSDDVEFTTEQMHSIDPATNTFTFINEADDKVVLTRTQSKKEVYQDLLY